MVTKITSALLSMVVASSLYAAEMSQSKRILGLEVGYTEVQGDTMSESGFEGSGLDIGIRLGAQSGEWRTLLIFDYYDNEDDDQNIEKGLVTLDYFFMGDPSENETSLNPYIGMNIGYANYESTLVEANGFVYGAQLGVTFSAGEQFEFDLGYRYSLSDLDALDHTGSAMFGVHFNY